MAFKRVVRIRREIKPATNLVKRNSGYLMYGASAICVIFKTLSGEQLGDSFNERESERVEEGKKKSGPQEMGAMFCNSLVFNHTTV